VTDEGFENNSLTEVMVPLVRGVSRRLRRLFNALNYLDRRGEDSTDWAD
jgi:hypothetical protein